MVSLRRITNRTSRRAIAFSGAKGYKKVVLGLGPIAYYRLDESGADIVYDSSGKSRHGSYVGTLLYNNASDPLDPGVLVAKWVVANNPLANISNAGLLAALSGTEGAMSAIMRPADAAFWTDGNVHNVVRFVADGSNYAYIWKDTTNGRLRFRRTAGGSNFLVDVDSMTSTDWMHVGIEWSEAANQCKAYLNGVQTGLTGAAAAWSGAITEATIGATASRLYDFSGWIGEVALFASPVGPEAMAQLSGGLA